jgi:hypothetical protein
MNSRVLTEEARQLIALGEFVLSFAFCEGDILRVLQTLSKVSPKVGQAVFSGVRAEGAVQSINRILEVSPKIADATKKRYSDAFKQFKHINDARNLILHHGLKREGKETVATNRRTALTESRVRTVPISANVLDAMSEDLLSIQLLLAVNDIALNPDGGEEKAEKLYGDSFEKSWRYTPPPQSPRGKSKSPNALKPRRPRGPSRA